jgi:hypothetical protein
MENFNAMLKATPLHSLILTGQFKPPALRRSGEARDSADAADPSISAD